MSEVASAVMRAHAPEGISPTKVDTWPVPVNVAMPTGLVVNELLTTLSARLVGREGAITLHSLVEAAGCRFVVRRRHRTRRRRDVAQAGQLGAMIAKSLRRTPRLGSTSARLPRGVRFKIFRSADAARRQGLSGPVSVLLRAIQ